MSLDRAQQLFERLEREGELAIDELITTFESESLWLDFKSVAEDGRGPRLDKYSLEKLAKAISGFGNSAGGVIVWGVDCRDDPRLGDVPAGTKLIENPERFRSWLEAAVSGCTAPPHSGVEHRALQSSATPGSGFVITLIRQAQGPPLQCIQPSADQRYYIRAGSSFRPVPHAVLSGLFGRRPQPQLSQKYLAPTLDVRQAAGNTTIEIESTLAVANRGRSIARDLYANVFAIPPGPACAITLELRSDDWQLRGIAGNVWNVLSEPGFRLAPGAAASIAVLRIRLNPPFDRAFVLQMEVGCEGAEPLSWRHSLTEDEVSDTVTNAPARLIRNLPKEKILEAFLGAPISA